MESTPWRDFLSGENNAIFTTHFPGNGKFIPPIKNGDDWGMVYYCLTHI